MAMTCGLHFGDDSSLRKSFGAFEVLKGIDFAAREGLALRL